MVSEHKFLRGTGTLVLGNIVAQSIVLLAYPVLTRIYNPEEFGLLAVYTSITLIVGTVACGMYDSAIALPNTERETVSVIAAAISVCAITTPVASLIFLATPWAVLLNDHGYSTIFIFSITTAGSAVMGLYSVYRYWGIKQENYLLVAKSRILQSVVRVVTQGGFFFMGATALILGGVASYVVGLFLLQVGNDKRIKTSLSEILSAMNRYRRFPLYSTWAAALNMSGKQMPIFVFAALFGPGPAGLYLLSERVIASPVSLVTSAVSATFLSESVKSKENDTLGVLVMHTHKLLANIATAPFLMLAIAAPSMFYIVFGDDWVETGVVASWVSLYLWLSFITAPFTMLFRTLERQESELRIQCSLFLARLIAIFIGAKVGGFIFAVACYSLVSTIYYLYVLVWVSKTVNLEPLLLIRQTVHSFAWSAITISPFILAFSFGLGTAGMLVGVLLSMLFVGGRLIFLLRSMRVLGENDRAVKLKLR